MPLFANVLNKLRRLADREYRDTYLHVQVRSGIAYQIQALRHKFELSQSEFAAKTGKTQSVVSRLENTEYGKVSVQTLLDIASSLDVALLVRFVSYPEFLQRTADKSVEALQPDTIFESLERYVASPQPLHNPYDGNLLSSFRRSQEPATGNEVFVSLEMAKPVKVKANSLLQNLGHGAQRANSQ